MLFWENEKKPIPLKRHVVLQVMIIYLVIILFHTSFVRSEQPFPKNYNIIRKTISKEMVLVAILVFYYIKFIIILGMTVCRIKYS